MLGYISSTRKKSCRQCAKAKRRCDLGYPCCKRCFAKGLACAYPNADVRESEVIIRQATPDLPAPVPRPGQAVVFGPTEPPLHDLSDPALWQPSDSSSSPDTLAGSPTEFDAWGRNQHAPPPKVAMRRHAAASSLRRELLPDIWAPSYLNVDQVAFLVSDLRNIMRTLVSEGHNPIVHRSLYSKRQPAAFDDSCSISALYLAKTPQNTPVIARTIQNKVTGFMTASAEWSLMDHLAAVQAMIVYQAIRLFDPSLKSVQADAELQNEQLHLWTKSLWTRSLTELPMTFDSPWDAWVFSESLRRTVLVSVLVRASYSCYTRAGLCDQIPTLANLPLNRIDRLWGMDEAEFEEMTLNGGLPTESLVAYGQWAYEWNHANDVNGLTDFQRVLMAACRGKDDPRLLPAWGAGLNVG